MLGLRTQESEQFNEFWSLIIDTAKKEKAVFFGDCGEGRDFSNDEMEGEDFSGWLIPEDKSEEFKKQWENGVIDDKWNDFIRFAIWNNINNTINIEFKRF